MIQQQLVVYKGFQWNCTRYDDGSWSVFAEVDNSVPHGTPRQSIIKKAKKAMYALDANKAVPKTVKMPTSNGGTVTYELANNTPRDHLKSQIITQYVDWTLATLKVDGGPAETPVGNNKEETKKGTTMYINLDKDITLQQRAWLMDSLYDVYTEKLGELRKQFNMDEESRPQSPKELVDRILAGEYQLPVNKDGTPLKAWGSWMDYDEFDERAARVIIWRNPAKVRDEAGYQVAQRKLEEAYETLRETVMLGTLEEGRKAKEAFKTATFH